MKGKTMIFIIVVVTIIALLFTWYYMQVVIEDFDIDRKASVETESLIS